MALEPDDSTDGGSSELLLRTSSVAHSIATRGVIPVLLIPGLAVLVAVLYSHFPWVTAATHSFIKSAKVANVVRSPHDFPEPPFALFSSRVVLPQHVVQAAYVIIGSNGKIETVTRSVLSAVLASEGAIVDVSPLVVMPGIIDAHVHVNEPGRTSWEGYYHASRAAAAGGTTTILDMPLNNIPSTVDRESLAQKVSALSSTDVLVDVGIIGGVIPGNQRSFGDLLEGGVLALKSFMVDSQSKDFPNVSKEDLKVVIGELHRMSSHSKKGVRPIPYILHAELDLGPRNLEEQVSQGTEYDHESYVHYEASRPALWEVEAIRYAAEVANESNVHIHIAHVASHEAVQLISDLRSGESLNKATLTAETCPHYLLWAKEEILTRGTLFKCSPPIRSGQNRERLIRATFLDDRKRGGIDLIASDHSPCPPELKTLNGNLSNAWGGISGLQYRLQGSWTAASTMNVSLVRMVELLAEGPARVFGIDRLKGFLKAGLDADIVIWDPDASSFLTEDQCHHRHKKSPFHGIAMRGAVKHTLLRGRSIYAAGMNSEPNGQFGTLRGHLLVRSPVTGNVFSIDPKDWHNRASHT